MIWDENRQVTNSLKADSIRHEVESSLKRLGIDTIDLYQIHWPDPENDIEEGLEHAGTVETRRKSTPYWGLEL